MVLGASRWYWLISLLTMLWDLTRPFVFLGIFFKFASNTLESFCALYRTTPGSQWAFGESSSGIEWSVSRPWLTLCMEEASQTFSHHLVRRAVATLRHECPSTSSVTGPRTWEASVRVWIWIWAQPSGPRSLPSANGSRRLQRSSRRDLVPAVMNHRSALGLWTIKWLLDNSCLLSTHCLKKWNKKIPNKLSKSDNDKCNSWKSHINKIKCHFKDDSVKWFPNDFHISNKLFT